MFEQCHLSYTDLISRRLRSLLTGQAAFVSTRHFFLINRVVAIDFMWPLNGLFKKICEPKAFVALKNCIDDKGELRSTYGTDACSIINKCLFAKVGG